MCYFDNNALIRYVVSVIVWTHDTYKHIAQQKQQTIQCKYINNPLPYGERKKLLEGFSMLSNMIPINNSLTLYAKHNKQYGPNAEGKTLKNAAQIIWHGLCL